MMSFRPLVFFAVFLIPTFFTNSVSAELVISFGNNGIVNLFPELAGQRVAFFVTGIIQVDGLEFDIQVGDGGADLSGTSTGPMITSIDLINRTIFENNGPNQQNLVAFPLARQSTVDTASKVMSDGMIGTVTFDTTGILLGDYELRLSGVAGQFNTTFFDGPSPLLTTAPSGILRVIAVPEPSHFFVFGIVTVGIIYWRRREIRGAYQAAR